MMDLTLCGILIFYNLAAFLFAAAMTFFFLMSSYKNKKPYETALEIISFSVFWPILLVVAIVLISLLTWGTVKEL